MVINKPESLKSLHVLSKRNFVLIAGLFLSVGFIYLIWQSRSIYGGDAGDLVTAAYIKGIPHPPGYPFYTLIGHLLISIIPFSTVAWRMGLLSSIPSIITVVIFAILFIKLIDKNAYIPAFIGALVLAFVYPFWLYSVVPEVFSLNNLFAVLLILWFHLWISSANKRYFWLFLLTLGLSLSHHHIILFLLPGFFYWGYTVRRSVKHALKKTEIAIGLAFLIIGLLPYIYIPLAARTNPIVNWDNPVTLDRIFRLITRADYGTFRSNQSSGELFLERFASFVGFLRLMVADFGLQGIIFATIGVVSWIKHRTTFLSFLLISLSSYAFFLFYAAFKLTVDFNVGTFERFILIPYIFISFFIAKGILVSARWLWITLKRVLPKINNKWLFLTIQTVFIFYPLGLFISNFPKISPLRNDFTAERLGRDVLNTTDKNSILLLANDTTYFNTLYVHTVEKVRPDVRLLLINGLFLDWYRESIPLHFPDIVIPKLGKAGFMYQFVLRNTKRSSLYSNGSLISNSINSFPIGVLWLNLPKNQSTPSEQIIITKNKQIWDNYQNPLKGILGTFHHLLLSDVLRIYSVGRQNVGAYLLLTLHNPKKALPYFLQSTKLTPRDKDGWILAGRAYLKLNQCDKAQKMLETAVSINDNSSEPYYYLSQTSRTCYKNEEKAKKYEKIYKEKKRSRLTPLNTL